jgi:hypothetical protein
MELAHIGINALSGIRTHDPSIRAGKTIHELDLSGHCEKKKNEILTTMNQKQRKYKEERNRWTPSSVPVRHANCTFTCSYFQGEYVFYQRTFCHLSFSGIFTYSCHNIFHTHPVTKSNDLIRNRTRDLLACRTEPRPSTLSLANPAIRNGINFNCFKNLNNLKVFHSNPHLRNLEVSFILVAILMSFCFLHSHMRVS